MHLYSGPTTEFISDTTQNRITSKLEASFFGHFRFKPPQSEVRSWQQSLRSMSTALQTGDLTDHGVVLEWQLPLSSRRLDCMVTGHSHADKAGAVVVELKQWEEAAPSAVEDCVTVFMGGRLRDRLHPSKQVGNYQRYLQDVHTAFSEGEVDLQACAYLHNLRYDPDAEVYAERHHQLLATNPCYAGDQLDDLVGFLDGGVGAGGGLDVLDTVLRGRYRPHKRLLDHTARVIAAEPIFVLLDEQQVAFNTVLAKVRARQLGPGHSAILIRGGPGTGSRYHSSSPYGLEQRACRRDCRNRHGGGSRVGGEGSTGLCTGGRWPACRQGDRQGVESGHLSVCSARADHRG